MAPCRRKTCEAKNSTGKSRADQYTSSADYTPSVYFESPTEPRAEFWPNVQRHGTSGRPSADGVASQLCHWRRDAMQ